MRGGEAGCVWLGRRGERARPGSGGSRAAGLRAAPSPHPPTPCPSDSVADRIRCLKQARGQVAWSYQGASSGSRPRKSAEGCTQVAVRVLFWLPRGRVRARSLPPALGEKRAGAARGGLWNAPGDHLLPAGPGSPAPRFPPSAEPSSCFWIPSLLSPQGWRHHPFRRPSLYFVQQYTQTHRPGV